MSLLQRGRTRLSVVIPNRKHDEPAIDYEQAPSPSSVGNISPDIHINSQPPLFPIASPSGSSLPASPVGSPLPANSPLVGLVQSPLAQLTPPQAGPLSPPDHQQTETPPASPPSSPPSVEAESEEANSTPTVDTTPEPLPQAFKIGNYILVQQTETQGDIKVFRAFHCDTQEEHVCKVVPLAKFHTTFSAYFVAGHHEHVNQMTEVLYGAQNAYVLFPRHHGDLHSYVRRRRRLREAEAGALFRQIMLAVHHCHSNGLVLRDLKLRKFVFKDAARTQLKLECVEDAFEIGEDGSDHLSDKHGCPAYVAPEILRCASQSYSGRSADMWSAGVMLYTLLVGRYPFHDVQPTALFTKIRRGDFRIPDSVSGRAKCLIRALLRRHPSQRLTAEHVLEHPWFQHGSRIYLLGNSSSNSNSTSLYKSPQQHNSLGSPAAAAAGITDYLDQTVPSFVPSLSESSSTEDDNTLPWFV